jgi:hypothetical protein
LTPKLRTLQDEEMRRLEEVNKREGLTVEQIVRLGITTSLANQMTSFMP